MVKLKHYKDVTVFLGKAKDWKSGGIKFKISAKLREHSRSSFMAATSMEYACEILTYVCIHSRERTFMCEAKFDLVNSIAELDLSEQN